MPAKKKITKEAIIETVVEILRTDGFERLNARRIAQRLGCSTQPIYSEFAGMEELKAALKEEAEKCYIENVRHYTERSEYSPYMAFGLGFIRFAGEDKALFRYLYMTDSHGEKQAIEDVNAPAIMQVLTGTYGYPADTARALHNDMAIYAYGLAVMLNTGYLDLSEESIKERLLLEFVALARAYGLPDGSKAPDLAAIPFPGK